MDQKTYLARLSFAARWRLPRGEAEEVVSDYEELVARSARPEEELGRPLEAVRLLGGGRAYAAWLAAFCALALALLFAAYRMFSHRTLGPKGAAALWLCCFVVCMAWFRRPKGASRTKLPRGLLPALGGLLLAAAALGALALCFLRFLPADARLGTRVALCLQLAGILSASAALAGLVAARVRDRRWRALFLLGLVLLLVCDMLLSHLRCMDLTVNPFRNLLLISCLGAAGLAGAGASLC